MPNNDHSDSPPPQLSSAKTAAERSKVWHLYALEAEQMNQFSRALSAYMSAWQEELHNKHYFESFIDFLNRLGQINELLKVYEIGAQVFSQDLKTLVNYSNLLENYGFYDKAKSVAESAIQIDEHCYPAWGNLGNANRGLGHFEQSIKCFERVLANEPDNVLAAFNLGCILLALNPSERAYELYENRLRLPGYERLRQRNSAPVWQGEPLDGKSILVYAEQGLGDTFMFGRFLRLLSFQGASIRFEVQSPIAAVMEGLIDVDCDIVSRKNTNDPCMVQADFQIPLLSLAKFDLEKSGVPEDADRGYLDPHILPIERVDLLFNRISGLKIGLCWQGNPHAAIDFGRSISLTKLRPLLDQKNYSFVSLQSRDGLEDIESILGSYRNFYQLFNLDQDTGPFSETLAIMRELDLIITTDTAIAHLAGAMGKPTWLLLQKYPEWRWGLSGSTTSWYPHMKLFRQTEPGDWDSVILNVIEALQ